MAGILDIVDRVINGGPKSKGTTPPFGEPPKVADLMNDMDVNVYKVESQNWYSAKPYGFRMNTRDKGTFTMFLPISPSNLNISTSFATNLIPTLYGTVEEHSDVRYFDITIEGTTGMAPKFVKPGGGDSADVLYHHLRESGRTTTSLAKSISAGGFFAKTLAQINNIKDKASDLLTGGPKAQTGLTADKSGYVAFHNLYRFLLQYKKDTALGSGKRQTHPLTFFNYKDNNEYDVVVRGFTMRKSAENPMLYYYSIQLRGYNLRSIKAQVNDDLARRLNDLGINGVDSSSLLGDIKSISRQAKGILGSLAGGVNVLGR